MGYIRVAHKEILNQLDNILYFPTGWNKFIEKQAISHNLIIKSNKNQCYCTNCYSTFISTKKINEKTKCPYCRNKYLIKRSNLKNYEFNDFLSILDKINNTLIIRYFELKTIIDANHKKTLSVVEFGREIPDKSRNRAVYVNDRVSRCQCYIHINHNDYCNEKKWREYTRNYSLIDYSIAFPNNIKNVLDNTQFKYSGLWNIVKHCNFYIDLSKFIQNTSEIPQIEILSKLKLYNLALDAYWCNPNGSFNSIFGVPKTFYQFMKRNNITYRQLQLLRILQEPNIKKIHYLESFFNYHNNHIETLKEISNYININRFIHYAKMKHHKLDIHLYKDYLRFATLLDLDLKNNRYAFPKNLKESHDKLEKQYEINNKKIVNQAIKKRSNELSKNIFKNNNFIVSPATSINDLQDESTQQNNCVRTYAEKYAEGLCDIYFMRYINAPKKSLVTVEVKNNKIVQSKIKNNRVPTVEQLQFLKIWEQKILNICV